MLAPAKINLFLHVAPRRADGYHELEALVGFVACGDEIEAERAADIRLDVVGPFAAELAGEDNIVLRAARALQAHAAGCGVSATGARLRLTKNLPVASGIGGGSSDAATALRVLCALWDMQPGEEALCKLGLELGADVPVCLFGKTAWMTGIGEVVEAAPALPRLSVLVVNPRVPVSTRDAYGGFDRGVTGTEKKSPVARPAAFADAAALVAFLESQRNDLEPAAMALAPVRRVLAELWNAGADLARMSGSGATCFGLFFEPGTAAAAVSVIRARNSGWWVVESELLP